MPLQTKPFELLVLLLENQGEVVSREQIRGRLWPDSSTGAFDQGVNTAVRKVRLALNDSADTPRFIETYAKTGYRFVYPAQRLQVAEDPTLDVAPPAPPLNLRARSRRLGIAAGVAAVAILIISVLWFSVARSGKPLENPPSLLSIVVMPLAAEPPDIYIAEGLTDAISKSLSRLSGIRVSSGVSARLSAASGKPKNQIARELGVQALVEGTIRRERERVVVRVKLIEANTSRELWTREFAGDMRALSGLDRDIGRAVQDEVARRARVQPRDPAILTTSPEAYEAYLRGRHFWNQRSAEAIRIAVMYLERAVEADASFAAAHAGLADCYNLLGYYGGGNPREFFPKAKASAARALEIDENLPEAHSALAYSKLHFDWDWDGAERSFLRSLELNPNYANAHHWYSHLLLAVGRHEAALAESRKALELDPLNVGIGNHLTHQYLCLERYDEAFQQAQRTLSIHPGHIRAREWLARAYEGKRDFRRGRDEILAVIREHPEDPRLEVTAVHVLVSGGEIRLARARAASLLAVPKPGSVTAFSTATVLAALGESDKALSVLERAVADRPEEMIYISFDPYFKSLRSKPRFAALTLRMGLPSPGLSSSPAH